MACPACNGLLYFRYSGQASERSSDNCSIWKYRSLLPICQGSKIISLKEGNTPLRESRGFGSYRVYVKDETLNPTGSHKDRCLSISVTKAIEFSNDTIILYSDGSAALSSAAYASRAGLKNIAVVPKGVPFFRLYPLMVYGSFILEYQGGPLEALDWVHEASRALGIYETSTYRRANPYGVEGSKTIGLEIFDQLQRVPDWIAVPVGGGGTLAGIYRAFHELREQGRISKLPRLIAVFPEGYDLVETASEAGVQTEDDLRLLARKSHPETVQVKIAMPFPPDGLEAIQAIRESNGIIVYATDAEVIAAQKKLGACDGIYAEPSGVASLAGLLKALREGRIEVGETVVVVITGSGFRETGTLYGREEVFRIPVDQSTGLKILEEIMHQKNREAQNMCDLDR